MGITYYMGAMLVLAMAAQVWSTADVMKDVTLGFGKALEHCREESKLTKEMMEEFYHFWNKDFKFEHREVGCAMHCMRNYFNLANGDQRMHHENTEAFIKSFPNGEILAKTMVEIIHTCEKKFDHEEDHCWHVLHVAECFKDDCIQRDLAPNMELIMAELTMN